MNIHQLRQEIELNLEIFLNENTPPSMRDMYRYALFPAGKLIRPLMTYALALDVDKKVSRNHHLFASALEIHHAYTLIHDDLPCMDNDLVRRGKPSLHVAFGEANALLVGDGLLNLSYSLLSKIESPKLPVILHLMGKLLGPSGLLLGQKLDLEKIPHITFQQILEIHKLKTARLFQMALLGSFLLCSIKHPSLNLKSLYRLGYLWGLCFQLHDDQKDVKDEISKNAFVHFPQEAEIKLKNYQKKLTAMIDLHSLDCIKNIQLLKN